jgi:hypothetical protein
MSTVTTVSDIAALVIADRSSPTMTDPDWDMSAHPLLGVEPTPHMTPAPTPNPADDGVDVVPGDPPVPLTVWRTPAGGDPTPIPDRLAYRLLAAYTTPGDTIIDLTGAAAIATVAATGSRGLIHATFTDTNQLTVTDTITAPHTGPGGHRAARSGQPPQLHDWFGDDLHHPDRPTSSDHPRHDVSPDVGAASLLLALWPLHPTHPIAVRRLQVLAAAAIRVLQPGGCVIFVVAGHPHRGNYTSLVEAATEAGLRYLQHIVAVAADIDADHLIYHATHPQPDEPSSGRHHRAHTDLLVFSTPQAGRVDG